MTADFLSAPKSVPPTPPASRDESSSTTDELAPEPRLRLVVMLTLLAAGIAGYLLVQTELLRGQPLGCGVDSACDEVLNSRWSKLLGMSVCIPALALHTLVLLCVMVLAGDSQGPERRVATRALAFAATLLLTAAGWFIAVQLFLLKQLCPWCLADHLLGIAIACAILSLPSIWKVRWLTPAILGTLAGAALAGVQLVQPETLVEVHDETANVDTGPGPERLVSLLQGRLRLKPHEVPVLGDPDAPAQIGIMFDYNCSHCRKTLGRLNALQAEMKGQFSLMLLPVPLNHECNRLIQTKKSGFEDSCKIAALAYAVYRAEPEQFAAYHHWLITGDEAPSGEVARTEAERLIGADQLAAALKDPWVNQQIQINAESFGYAHQAPLPILLTIHITSMQGFPSDPQLLEIIAKASQEPRKK